MEKGKDAIVRMVKPKKKLHDKIDSGFQDHAQQDYKSRSLKLVKGGRSIKRI